MTRTVPLIRATTLDDAECRALRVLVGAMIPSSADYGVPGADDDRIFADIVASVGRDLLAVRAALAELDRIAGGSLVLAPPQMQAEAIAAFRECHPSLVPPLVALTTRCYYRDDRVMQAIGMEVRPPYPKGFEVEQGDWSLLDPVRARGPIWRPVT
jgi:hypothetical protein